MSDSLRKLAREIRRGAFGIGAGVIVGLIAAFGLVAPVFQKNLVVHATPSDALAPCPKYQALLDQHLHVLWANDASTTPPTRRPVLTTFDYARLVLQPDGKTKLQAVRKELLDVRPSRMGPRARTAWAINAHNFLVIDAVVKHGFPNGKAVSSAQGIIGKDDPHPLVMIEGTGYTLEAFDREFLFADGRSNSTSPTASLDPRIHFALSSGARGGAPIHPRAYRPETLDAQLDDVTRGALLGSKHLRWNGMTRELAVSSIFQLHAADFGGADSAFAFVMTHIPARTADQIRAAGVTGIPASIDMDWSLNQTPSR